MSNIVATANNTFYTEKRHSSRDWNDEENKLAPKLLPKNEIKNEYDIQESEIIELEKYTNSKFLCNIGVGGFSTVKLIFSHTHKSHFALKVVSKPLLTHRLI